MMHSALQFMKRITRKLVRINHPFRIADGNWTYPAGEYEITTEEEELGGGSYRHLRTTIYVPKSKGSTGIKPERGQGDQRLSLLALSVPFSGLDVSLDGRCFVR